MEQEVQTPLDSYTRRAAEVQVSAEETDTLAGRYQAGSLFLLLLAGAFLYRALILKTMAVWAAVLPIAAAISVVKQALKYRRKVLKLVSVREYCDKGIARLKRDWKSLDDGNDFKDPEHIYAMDLDLFGRGSLFQLLCSARTHVGRESLANWMETPASRDEVLARREAVEELSGRRALIESVASAGTSTVSDCRPGTFRDWVAEMSANARFPPGAPIMAFLLALVLVTLPFFYWTSHLSLQNLWLGLGAVLALEAAFAAIFSKQVRSILESVHSPSAELPVICELLEIVEREKFSSPKLAALVNHLKCGKSSASSSMLRLRRLVRLLEERNSQWFTLLSWCLLWVLNSR